MVVGTPRRVEKRGVKTGTKRMIQTLFQLTRASFDMGLKWGKLQVARVPIADHHITLFRNMTLIAFLMKRHLGYVPETLDLPTRRRSSYGS